MLSNAGKKIVITGFSGWMLISRVAALSGEDVVLTTYYPAPSGVYKKMITTSDTILARNSGNITLVGPANGGGKVGIGTTNPQATLEVNGNIIASAPTAANQLATKAYVDAASGKTPTLVSANCTRCAGTCTATAICPSGTTVKSAGTALTPAGVATLSDAILRAFGSLNASTCAGASSCSLTTASGGSSCQSSQMAAVFAWCQ